MTAPRRIGILGGMGPEATILLMQRLVEAVPARDDADHIPLIVDQNTQVPSRIAALLNGTGADPGPVLVAMARGLQAQGADALAMPCNTAHHYAPRIAGAVGIPFLDMVELSADAARAAAAPGARVAVLASPAVRQIGLFDRALAARGLVAAWPEDQDALLTAIRAIKSRGDIAAARRTLSDASTALHARGATVQLVACSEFSIIADAVDPGATAIDTLDTLVSEIIRFATGTAGGMPIERQAG